MSDYEEEDLSCEEEEEIIHTVQELTMLNKKLKNEKKMRETQQMSELDEIKKEMETWKQQETAT